MLPFHCFLADTGDLDLAVDPRDQLPRRERLHEIVVRARLEARDACLLAGAGRYQDHGDTAGGHILPERPQQFDPVAVRHHHVAQDEVGTSGPGRVERGLAVTDYLHGPVLGEKAPQVVAHVGVVVGQQDASALRGDGPGRGRHQVRRDVVREPAQCLLDVGRRAEADRRRRAGRTEAVSREVGGSERDRDREGGAPVDLAGYREGAAVELDQLLCQRESDARSLVRAPLRAAHTVKPIEHVRQLVLGDADAGVTDLDRGGVAGRPDGHDDLALEGELQGIREQIQDDLLPQVSIDVDRLRERPALHAERQPRALDRRAEDTREIGGHRRQIDRLVHRFDPTGLDPRELQQSIDESHQSHRVPVGDLEPLASRRRDRLAGIRELILDGPEQQRERRAKLVRHVREERGLRPVDLGEGLGTAALLFEGLRVGQRRGDLGGHQLEERPVVLVEGPHATDRRDEDGAGKLLPGKQDGKDEPGVRRGPPGPRGQRLEGLAEISHDLGSTRAGDHIQRPDAGRVGLQCHRPWRRRSAWLDARGGFEQRDRLATVDAVDEGEGHVTRVLGQDVDGAPIDRGLGAGALGLRREVPQGAQTALADDLPGGLDHRAEDTADVPLLVVNRAVREREICFLGISPVDVEQQVPRPCRVTPFHHLREHRLDDVPDLRPDLGAGLPQGGGMLGRTEDLAVLVVVHERQLPSPEDHDGKGARQGRAHRGPEGLRPLRDGTEGRPRPVERTDALPHLAPAGEPALTSVAGGGHQPPGPRSLSVRSPMQMATTYAIQSFIDRLHRSWCRRVRAPSVRQGAYRVIGAIGNTLRGRFGRRRGPGSVGTATRLPGRTFRKEDQSPGGGGPNRGSRTPKTDQAWSSVPTT